MLGDYDNRHLHIDVCFVCDVVALSICTQKSANSGPEHDASIRHDCKYVGFGGKGRELLSLR